MLEASSSIDVKNRRASLFLVAIVIGAAFGTAWLLRWYRSGQVPAGPGDFIDLAEIERAIHRIDSFRYPLPDAAALCLAVSNHIEGATALPYSNPAEAVRALRDLRSDLQSIAASYGPAVTELERGHPGGWEKAYVDFLRDTESAYSSGARLLGLQNRRDPVGLSSRRLLDDVIEAKSLCGDALKFPPWSGNDTLRRYVYPALDTAYREREQTSPIELRRLLIEPAPALVHWYYARRYQDQATFAPGTICAAGVLDHAAELDDLQADLKVSAAADVLADWEFPSQRAANSRQLAALLQPLEDAETLNEWMAVRAGQSGAAETLFATVQAAADSPDPPIKLILLALDDIHDQVSATARTVKLNRTLDSTARLAASLERIRHEHMPLADCALLPLKQAEVRAAALGKTAAGLTGPGVQTAEELVTILDAVQESARGMARELGDDIERDYVNDAFERWCCGAGAPPLDVASESIRLLSRKGLLEDPVLVEVASLMDRIHESSSPEVRGVAAAMWQSDLRGRAAGYPRLIRRINGALGAMEQQSAEDELRTFAALGKDRELREAAERILVQRKGERWAATRDAAQAILMILALPGHLEQRRHGELALLRDTLASHAPPAPAGDAPHAELFQARIQPLLTGVELAAGLQSGAAQDELARRLLQLPEIRRRVAAQFPGWREFDRVVLRQATALQPPCLPPVPEILFRLADMYDEMKLWPVEEEKESEQMGRLAVAAAAVATLLRADPGPKGGTEEIERAREAVERAGGINHGLEARLARLETEVAFVQAMQEVPPSFQALREFLRRPPVTPDRGTLIAYRQALAGLQPIVEADMEAIQGAGSYPALEVVADEYTAFASRRETPARLGAYAMDQAAALRTYGETREYRLRQAVAKADRKAGVEVPYSVLGTGVASLGYGRRSKGSGEGLRIWLQAGSNAVVLLTAEWRDDIANGALRLRSLQPHDAAVSWQWGEPVTIGIQVAHTDYDNRDLVPDPGSGRSRWNPFNYGVFRVETHDYPVARFDSLDQLARECAGGVDTNALPSIVLDSLFAAIDAPAHTTRLRYRLEGIPAGRDMDWPEQIEPLSVEELQSIRGDVEQAVSNLLESVFP
jgi:hypothetical protein